MIWPRRSNSNWQESITKRRDDVLSHSRLWLEVHVALWAFARSALHDFWMVRASILGGTGIGAGFFATAKQRKDANECNRGQTNENESFHIRIMHPQLLLATHVSWHGRPKVANRRNTVPF
jgi:hypothetical protein